jgi:hypothetical protein
VYCRRIENILGIRLVMDQDDECKYIPKSSDIESIVTVSRLISWYDCLVGSTV